MEDSSRLAIRNAMSGAQCKAREKGRRESLRKALLHALRNGPLTRKQLWLCHTPAGTAHRSFRACLDSLCATGLVRCELVPETGATVCHLATAPGRETGQ